MDKTKKKYLFFTLATIFVICASLGACSGCSALSGVADFLGFTTQEQCTVCEDVMPDAQSLICERMENPCQVLDAIKMAAGEGVVWEVYTIDQAINWLEQEVKPRIAPQWTYDRLRLFIFREVSEFNTKAGGTFFLLTRAMQQFKGTQPLLEKDIELMRMALDSLIADLKELKLILGSNQSHPKKGHEEASS